MPVNHNSLIIPLIVGTKFTWKNVKGDGQLTRICLICIYRPHVSECKHKFRLRIVSNASMISKALFRLFISYFSSSSSQIWPRFKYSWIKDSRKRKKGREGCARERRQRACAGGSVLSKNQVNRSGESERAVTSLLHIELEPGRGSSEWDRSRAHRSKAHGYYEVLFVT